MADKPYRDPKKPHYQHLAHHAVWDKTSGDETIHDDLMRAMRGYAEGGDVNPQTQAMRRAVARYNEGKSVKAKHPAVYPAVPEIPKAQINSMAERMYAQMTGQSNPNAKTQIQMAREKDLPIDVREHAAPLPKPVIDMAQHKGAHIVGVPGDTSIGGMLPPGEGGLERSSHAAVTLHGIGNKQFEHDVPQYGGEMYGGYGHPFKWAGGEAGVRPIEKAVKQIHAYDPEAKIMGQFVKMTPQSLDFALHNLDTMLQYMEPHKLPPAQRELLDRLLAGKYGTHPAMAHSPGFADPHELLLQAQQDSKLRKKAVQILATKKNMPAGTGPWEDVQYAISHPHLRNMETGAGGSTIMEMDPHESYKNLFSPNPTYKHELPTKEEGVGRAEFMQPAELAYPRSLAYAKEAIQRLPEKKRARVQPFNMMKMIGMRELVDPQYIDQLGQYNQRMRELMGTGHQGYAEGGEVKQEPSQDEMMAHVMLSKGKPALVSLKSIGADEAPNMPIKEYVSPGGGKGLPVGGVDFQPENPGQQMMPGQPGQPQGGQPQGGQPQGGPAPQGAPGPLSAPGPLAAAQGPQSNILQMTPQGQAMSAMRASPPMQRPGMPKMAMGGRITDIGMTERKL